MRTLVLLLLVACVPGGYAAQALDTSRVVVVDGGLTATVYALGLGDRVVAVDTTSQWPPKVRDKPTVGYMRALSAEGILSVAPTLVLATDEAGPANVFKLIEASGVPVKQFAAPRSAADVRATIRHVAALFDCQKRGQALIEQMGQALSEARHVVAGYRTHPRVLFVLSAGGQLLAAGRGTAAAAVIKLAGGSNIVDYTGYKPLSPEAAVALAPDVIVTGSHVIDALGSRQALLARPELALTPAGRHGRLVVMDSLRLLGFGPRLGSTVSKLAHRLHERDKP